MWKSAFRLSVLRRLCDRAVDHLGLGLLLLGVAGAFSRFTMRDWGKTDGQETWALTALIIAAVAYIILQWTRLRDLKSRLESRLKYLIYQFARTKMPLGGANNQSNWPQLLVSEPFRTLSFRRKDQTDLADHIALMLRDRKHIFLVEGESGVGKTAAAIVLIDRLMSDPDLFQHTWKIFYLDLAMDGRHVEQFFLEAASGVFSDATIIIDNFHRIPPRCIENFSNLARPNRKMCGLLLILSQPREYVTFCPGADSGPFRSAEGENCAFRLSAPAPDVIQKALHNSAHFEKVAAALDAIAVPVESPLRWLAHVNLEKLYQMTSNDMDRAMEIILLTKDFDRGGDVNHVLHRVLAVISALAIHRGAFNSADLILGLRAVSERRLFFISDVILLKSCFERLRHQGIIIEAIGQRRAYVFHQAMAEHLKDRLMAHSAFANAFTATLNALRSASWVEQDPLMKWLFAIELSDEPAARSCFSDAMCSGAFGVMRHAMLRNTATCGSKGLSYERGVLAERVGAWAEAKEAFARTRAGVQPGSDDWAWTTIAAVESAHAEDSRCLLQQVIDAANVSGLARAAAQYWILHLDAHVGKFDLDGIINISKNIEENVENYRRHNMFELIHISRRVVFDCARFYYLIGHRDNAQISSIFASKLARFLQGAHPYYEAYRQKFYIAHSLHYDYLYEMGALKRSPSTDVVVLNAAKLNDTRPLSRNDITDAAINAYKTAADRFEMFGDKTAYYIKSRILELHLTMDNIDFDEEIINIKKYENFVSSSLLADLAPYPHVYRFKLYIRMASDLMQKSLSSEAAERNHAAAWRNAEASLQEAKMKFEIVGNRYGTTMCNLFSAVMMLFEAERQPEARARLSDIKAEAGRMKYCRIEELAEFLESPQLMPMDLYDLIMFFPFVHQ